MSNAETRKGRKPSMDACPNCGLERPKGETVYECPECGKEGFDCCVAGNNCICFECEETRDEQP